MVPSERGPSLLRQKSSPQLSQKFAWGISTASYQYEDPAVKPGDNDYFYSDWDILIEQRKAPPKGNALYSWTRFDKDLEALKKIGVTHYRFSISWPRVEPQPGVYNEKAIRGYVEMARRLKAAGIEPVICLWHFTFPSWLYDKKKPGESNWLHPLARTRWNAYVDRMVRATAPYTTYYAPQNEPNGQITTAYIVGVWPPGMDLAFGHYWKAIDASTGMFRDAAARIKSIKPTAKVMSVEALPWWERAPLDPGGAIYKTMIHGNVDHLDRIYDVCDILGINYYYSQAPGPALTPCPALSPRPQLHDDGLAHRSGWTLQGNSQGRRPLWEAHDDHRKWHCHTRRCKASLVYAEPLGSHRTRHPRRLRCPRLLRVVSGRQL